MARGIVGLGLQERQHNGLGQRIAVRLLGQQGL